MSVVAAKVYDDRIVMSADSILTNGYEKEPNVNFAKIAKINDIILGGVGYGDEQSLMWLYMENHQPVEANEREILNYIIEFSKWKNTLIGNGFLRNEFLIAYKGHLFHICKFMVREIKDYFAIGAGAPYATTALYLKHDPEESVKVACDICYFVSEPIKTFIQEKEDKK